jgi:hypothetical protein
MDVWVVCSSYGAAVIIGVFSTELKARACCERLGRDGEFVQVVGPLGVNQAVEFDDATHD